MKVQKFRNTKRKTKA